MQKIRKIEVKFETKGGKQEGGSGRLRSGEGY